MLDVKDRIPAIGKAGRKKITYENGHEEYATIEMADEPIEPGTPINRALFESIRADLENVMASLVPPGLISMWSGSASNIPTGWTLCDGSKGSPDLRDKFVVGAGSTYTVGASGGEAAHTLSIAEMPAHSHGVLKRSASTTSISRGEGVTDIWDIAYHLEYGFNTENTGGGQAHNNLPPYYALCYIMKL